ncbi:MAG: hypothetical protein CMJ18_06100 [Phycisphaeraceae bacterium]|nr:hypothetical protein [Phycisphaeraceae bacterium]
MVRFQQGAFMNHVRSSSSTAILALALCCVLRGQLRANDRYDAWQSGRPYVLSAWGTHDRGGGGKLNVDYFLASGLNTCMDNRCAYGSRREIFDADATICSWRSSATAPGRNTSWS